MKKIYLYHGVPINMQGNILYRLNSLKEVYPEIYLSAVKKYENRKNVMGQFIPTLKCLWNDVLHFTAISPAEINQAWIEAGMGKLKMKFYEIDPNLLDPKQTTIYLYQEKRYEDRMNIENFAEYNPEKLEEYSILSQVTKDYYKKEYTNGKNPFIFVRVPHILYKGSIDISNLPIIIV